MKVFYICFIITYCFFEEKEVQIFSTLFKMSDYNISKYYKLCQKYEFLEFAEKSKYYIPNHFPLRGGGVIKSGVGMRIHPISGIYKMHKGVDIIDIKNDTIFSTMNGFVKKISTDNNGYGLHIKIVNEYGFESLYAHCSQVLVGEGDIVDCNTAIAIMGDTGYATGKHLHYEIQFRGILLNPLTILDAKRK